MLLFLLACTNTDNVDRISLQGGTWTVEYGSAFSIQQEGVGYYFTVDDYLFGHCISNCIGNIVWPKEELTFDAKSAVINLHSIKTVEAKLKHVDIMLQNISDISIQSIYGDIWVEAPHNAKVSILSSYGDVEVLVPPGEWQSRLYGKSVSNQLTEESKTGGLLEVFNADGNVRISEIKPLSAY